MNRREFLLEVGGATAAVVGSSAIFWRTETQKYAPRAVTQTISEMNSVSNLKFDTNRFTVTIPEEVTANVLLGEAQWEQSKSYPVTVEMLATGFVGEDSWSDIRKKNRMTFLEAVTPPKATPWETYGVRKGMDVNVPLVLEHPGWHRISLHLRFDVDSETKSEIIDAGAETSFWEYMDVYVDESDDLMMDGERSFGPFEF